MEGVMRGAGRFWMLLAIFFVASNATISPHAATREPQTPPMDTSLFRTIARQQNPAVVAIMTTTRYETPVSEATEWLERFFGRPLPRGPHVRREIGSGFLISRDGDILTNDHVVADADLIEVRLLGRETTTYRATVVGRDPMSDSAVIRLKNAPRDLPVATLGDSSALETGDWVMAIGNPFQLGHSVTVGVVSYKERSFEIAEDRWLKLIQTDASINPGSSGGPLFNVRGEVVGINVAMLSNGLGDSIGIGFAVPINSVKEILPQMRLGDVVRGHLRVRLRRALITENDAAALGLPRASGALIMSVERPSSAEAAGFRAGDVVITFADAPVVNAEDLIARVAAMPPGARAEVTVIRGGHTRALQVSVEVLPAETQTHAEPGVEPPTDFGLTLGDLAPSVAGESSGAIVQHVRDDSEAARAGIEKGDIIRKVNRRAVHTAADAVRELQRLPESTAFMLIWREGDELLIEIRRD
jgi:serine protease Do